MIESLVAQHRLGAHYGSSASLAACGASAVFDTMVNDQTETPCPMCGAKLILVKRWFLRESDR